MLRDFIRKHNILKTLYTYVYLVLMIVLGRKVALEGDKDNRDWYYVIVHIPFIGHYPYPKVPYFLRKFKYVFTGIRFNCGLKFHVLEQEVDIDNAVIGDVLQDIRFSNYITLSRLKSILRDETYKVAVRLIIYTYGFKPYTDSEPMGIFHVLININRFDYLVGVDVFDLIRLRQALSGQTFDRYTIADNVLSQPTITKYIIE